MNEIQAAQERFGELIRSEYERIERMKKDKEVKDFSKLETIRGGTAGGRHRAYHHGAGPPGA